VNVFAVSTSWRHSHTRTHRESVRTDPGLHGRSLFQHRGHLRIVRRGRQGARVITGTNLAIATPVNYPPVAWLDATEFPVVRGEK
jgi:hypothetical protein